MTISLRVIALVALPLMMAGAGRGAGPGAAPDDPTRLGPQVGDAAPTFTLSDQHGKARSLESLLGPNGAMIVFSRSADW
jgi:cytochrome oxidase Cu insertion factor (SCO1/SenC/PrrC family)